MNVLALVDLFTLALLTAPTPRLRGDQASLLFISEEFSHDEQDDRGATSA